MSCSLCSMLLSDQRCLSCWHLIHQLLSTVWDTSLETKQMSAFRNTVFFNEFNFSILYFVDELWWFNQNYAYVILYNWHFSLWIRINNFNYKSYLWNVMLTLSIEHEHFIYCKNLIQLTLALLKFCSLCWKYGKFYKSQPGVMMCFPVDIECHSIVFLLLCNTSHWQSMALLYRAAQYPCSTAWLNIFKLSLPFIYPKNSFLKSRYRHTVALFLHLHQLPVRLKHICNVSKAQITWFGN